MAGRKERRGPREEAVACTVDPLRVDKTERGEGRNESGRRFNALPPLQKWRIDGVLLVAGIEGLFDL